MIVMIIEIIIYNIYDMYIICNDIDIMIRKNNVYIYSNIQNITII